MQARLKYLADGFEVLAQEPTSLLLIKRKQFNVVVAIATFLFCMLPFVLYLIAHSMEKDRIVEIRLVSQGQPAEPLSPLDPTAPPQLSADGKDWWDGKQWQAVAS